MKKLIVILIIFLIIINNYILSFDSDLFFYLLENEKNCFIEELPEDTILLIEYKNPQYKHKNNIYIKIINNKNKIVLNQLVNKKYGKIAYLSRDFGEHNICIESIDSKWPSNDKTAKFHIKLELKGKNPGNNNDQEDTINTIAKKKHIIELENELKLLEEKIDLILKDLLLSKEQEIHFTEQSNRINSRIMWWSLLQTALLLLSGFWQILHLKTFFRKKKLI